MQWLCVTLFRWWYHISNFKAACKLQEYYTTCTATKRHTNQNSVWRHVNLSKLQKCSKFAWKNIKLFTNLKFEIHNRDARCLFRNGDPASLSSGSSLSIGLCFPILQNWNKHEKWTKTWKFERKKRFKFSKPNLKF